MTEPKHTKGCGHFDSSSGVCRLMNKNISIPSLATIAEIYPPGAFEGPPVYISGWLCSAADQPETQENCSAHTKRLLTQDSDDYNL